MQTLNELVTSLQDLLGITGTLTASDRNRLDRIVNLGKDRVVAHAKWDFLETSTNQLFTSGTRLYNPNVAMKAIISLEDQNGSGVRKTERDTYDRFFRNSTATATNPEAYTLQGVSTNGTIEFQVWPTPSSNSTGRVRYRPRVADLTSANGTLAYDFIPMGLYAAILAAAKVELYKQEKDDGLSAKSEQEFKDAVADYIGMTVSPVIREGAEQ